MMYKFQHIEYLYLLAVVPLFILLQWWYFSWQRKQRKKFAEQKFISSLVPELSKGKPVIKFTLLILAFCALIIGLANPQLGSKLEEVKREGVDLMIALDLSNSMLAEDLTPNRLERAKRSISKLIDNVKNDRIGIVVFAGQAFVQLPITTDYSAAKLFLSTVNTDIMPVQGTAIGNAIDLSLESFDFENQTSKAIVIITDGEDHEDDPLIAARKAQEKGVIVHTIGMGSPKGVPIPLYYGNQKIGFRKDKAGNSVVSKLNESILKDIAQAGGGIYVRATNAQNGLDYIFSEIEKMEKVNFDAKVFTDYESRFPFFVGIALVLLILDLLIIERKNKWLNSEKLFGN